MNTILEDIEILAKSILGLCEYLRSDGADLYTVCLMTEDSNMLQNQVKELYVKISDTVPLISEKTLDSSRKYATITSKETSSDGGSGSGFPDHKGIPGKRGGSLPEGTTEQLTSALSSGQISQKLNRKKQSRHSKDSPEYKKCIEQGRKMSVVTISNEEVDKLIQKYSGKGHIFTKNGQFKETFDHTEKIGIYVDVDGNESETNRGTIHYSKNGTHLVPAVPKRSRK